MRLFTTYSKSLWLSAEGWEQAIVFAAETLALNGQKRSGSPWKLGIRSWKCFTNSKSLRHFSSSIVHEAIGIASLRLYNARKRKENEHENKRQSWKIRFTTIINEYFRSFRMKITNVMINVLRLTELRLKLCFNGFFTFVFYFSYLLRIRKRSILWFIFYIQFSELESSAIC